MYTTQTNIGIIGSGIVGQVLANAFISEGNPVMLGTRDTNKPAIQKWHAENPGAEQSADGAKTTTTTASRPVAGKAVRRVRASGRARSKDDERELIGACRRGQGKLSVTTDANGVTARRRRASER